MDAISFYDAKPYDKIWFDRLAGQYGFELKYHDAKLSSDTATLSRGCRGAVAFVNDTIDAGAIDGLLESGIEVLAMRCAGFNNIDMKHAQDRLKILRVPAYSPNAVAEHAMAMLLCLVRKLHRAYNRTRDYNFSLQGLTGFDLYGKTVGVIGTGKIGQAFLAICHGFGMRVIAYDPYPVWGRGVEYVNLDDLFRRADVISLHCPLTADTRHIVDKNALRIMKNGVYIINTSRGALIDSAALLDAIKSGKVGGAGLDVYEEESNVFYEDVSGTVIQDDVLNLLLSMPNVLVTSHQGFLTDEALHNIAETTLNNLRTFFDGGECPNEISYEMAKQTV